MSCVLRASGKNFDVDSFLKKSKLQPCAVFRRGEPKFMNKPKGKKRTMSGLNIPVSNAAMTNFRKQVKDAIQFMSKNKKEIRKLINAKGIDGTELDFGTSRDEHTFLQEFVFPIELTVLASSLGLEVRLSSYPVSDDKKNR